VDPIAQLASEPGRAALFLDVDGTLSPIAPRPEQAFVPEETRTELRRLVDRYALVACVSGRMGEDARRLVGVEGIVYAGEHGLELEPRAEAWAERLATFAETAGWPDDGKRLSRSFHYRTHPDQEAAHATLQEVERRAREHGFRTRWGRKLLEVMPPVDASKATAVARLLAEHDLRRGLYAGDDTTDLDGFRALDGLELAVRVAVRSPEAPPTLAEAADVVVDSPEELLEVLRRL
jgi:trehalose 6-phosphate phosphatase